MNKKPSQRFAPSNITTRLVPAFLAVILLGLLAVIVITALAILGITPGA
jgi:hypothetical protein